MSEAWAGAAPGGHGRVGWRSAGLVLGITSMAAGAIVLAWPEATVAVVAWLFGLQLLVYGVVRIAQALATREAAAGERTVLVLLGLLSIVVGVLCMRHLLQTVTALTLLVGLFLLAGGLLELVRAVAGRSVRSGLELLGGVLGILAGIVALCWPRPTVLVLVLLFGFWLFLFGAVTIASALWTVRARLA
jgi:uncharacterized membrane protein HdeD (DUF308 family)